MTELTETRKETSLKKSCNQYQFEVLTDKHAPEVIELFTKAFCENEPLTKHLEIDHREYERFVKEVVDKVIAEGLSVVALDEKGKVIACTLAEDIANFFEPNLQHYPHLKPVLALLEDLSKGFLKGKNFAKGKVAHVWIALVDEKHRGEGLSTEIDMRCGSRCVEKGYDFAYAEFTNPISEKITKHYKVLKLCNTIDYDQYELSGEHPFKGVGGKASAYLVGIKPGIKIEAFQQCYKDMK